MTKHDGRTTEEKADRRCGLCLFSERALSAIVIWYIEGICSTMTQDAIEKMEEKILRDGSLTDERKAELLKLLKTMKTEKKPKIFKER